MSDDNKPKKIIKKRVLKDPSSLKTIKKSWLEKNYKTLIISLIVIVLFQGVRGCFKSNASSALLKNDKALYDIEIDLRNQRINALDSIIDVRDDRIQYLEYELRVAGIKVLAAEDKADAVQQTAEKVKNNTTTTIKIQTDTTSNKVRTNKNE